MISTRTYLQQNATKIAELCKKEIRKKQQRSSKANKESRINKSKKLVKEVFHLQFLILVNQQLMNFFLKKIVGIILEKIRQRRKRS